MPEKLLILLNPDQNWPYPLPEEIYRQIILNKNNSLSTKYLFEVLGEIGSIFSIDLNIKYEELKQRTKYEINNYYSKKVYFRITETILSRYIQVRNKLGEQSFYKDYMHYLPKINFDKKNKYHQKWIKIELNSKSNWH